MLLLIPVLLLPCACAASQTFVNDSGLPAYGVQIEFSAPVTITSSDPIFPHHHPPDASRSFWFFGWKLPQSGEITLDWRPEAAKVVGIWWLRWLAAQPLEGSGMIDAFEDEDLICDLGAEWIAQPCSGAEPPDLACARDASGDGCLELKTRSPGTVSVAIDFAPIDVSAYGGLCLRMSAAEPADVSVELMARDPECNSGYRFVNSAEPARVSDQAVEYRFPLASFETEPGECPVDVAALLTHRLIHIALFASLPDAGVLRIHEVGFYLPDNL